MDEYQPVDNAWWVLRIALGLGAFLAGLDKFFNLLADWPAYLSPIVERFVAASTFMHVVGGIEVAAGLLLLAGVTRLGGYVVAAWLVGISLNLLTTGRFYDVAVRDLEMAVAAFTLARLTESRQARGVAASGVPGRRIAGAAAAVTLAVGGAWIAGATQVSLAALQ